MIFYHNQYETIKLGGGGGGGSPYIFRETCFRDNC